MSLFKVDPENPFNGSHQELMPQTYGTSLESAKSAMILVHGRGATAESMLPLADEFSQPDIHYVVPQAANHTWYPYSFLAPTVQNEAGISSGLQVLQDVLTRLVDEGMNPKQIILLGFSQGACLASEFVARHPQKLGGLVAFSGGLVGPEVNFNDYEGTIQQTPVFLGCSNVDPHIPKERVDETEAVFKKLGGDVTKRIYKGMGHTVNDDEINFVRGLLKKL